MCSRMVICLLGLTRKITTGRSTFGVCRISRKLWPFRSLESTLNLLSFDSISIFYYSSLKSELLGYIWNYFCRSCLEEEEDYSIRHPLYKCPALQGCRLNSFRDLECLRNVPVINFLGFPKSTRWFLRERIYPNRMQFQNLVSYYHNGHKGFLVHLLIQSKIIKMIIYLKQFKCSTSIFSSNK